MTDTISVVQWGGNGPEIVTCRDPFARERAISNEKTMRADQELLGEHGEDVLIAAQDLREQINRDVTKAIIFGEDA